MKKKLIIGLAVISLFSLSACSKKNDPDLGNINQEVYPEEEEPEIDLDVDTTMRYFAFAKDGITLDERTMDINNLVLKDFPFAMSEVMKDWIGTDEGFVFEQDLDNPRHVKVEIKDTVPLIKYYYDEDNTHIRDSFKEKENPNATDVQLPEDFIKAFLKGIDLTIKENYPAEEISYTVNNKDYGVLFPSQESKE